MKKSITITNNNQSDMVKVTAFGIDIKKNHSVVLFFFSWSFKLSLKLFYLKFVIFYVSKCNRIRFLREIYIREKTIFLLLFFFFNCLHYLHCLLLHNISWNNNIITISQHIKNPGIIRTFYSSILRHILGN